MRFHETPLPGCFLIETMPLGDHRGRFVRTFCAETFGARGLVTAFSQVSSSFTALKGSLRGLHFQAAPAMETKLIRVGAGRVQDVVVDLRPGSPAFGAHFSVELATGAGQLLYVPKGFAHGFQSLTDDVEMIYMIDEPYRAELARGLRFDHQGIVWPLPPQALSARDLALPSLEALDPADLLPWGAG